VQRPMRLLVPIGRVTTARTRLPDVVATVGDDLGLRQGCGRRDPFARVGSVLTWTEHRVALLAQWLGPVLYDKRLLGATRSLRYSLDISATLWKHRGHHVGGDDHADQSQQQRSGPRRHPHAH